MKQEKYWDKEVAIFDSIYSHEKNFIGNLLDKIFRWDMYARFDYTMKNSEPIEGKTFLDVGCGTGKFVFEFIRRGAKKIVGLDISQNMIDECEKRAREKGINQKCSFKKTDLLQFDHQEKFDIVIGIGLFDYIKNPLPILNEMQSRCKDKVIVSFPRFWTWRAPVRKFRLGIKGCSVFFFKRKQIATMMNQAGFDDYSIKKTGQLFCVVGLKKSE